MLIIYAISFARCKRCYLLVDIRGLILISIIIIISICVSACVQWQLIINISSLVWVKIFNAEHLTCNLYRTTSTLNAKTDEDKDDTVNQLTSDVNSWRHCPDCFFFCQMTPKNAASDANHAFLCTSVLAVVSCLKAIVPYVNIPNTRNNCRIKRNERMNLSL